MMAASLALPLALFLFAAADVVGVDRARSADREIERALDVAHEHALKVFETIDRSLSEIERDRARLSRRRSASRESDRHGGPAEAWSPVRCRS